MNDHLNNLPAYKRKMPILAYRNCAHCGSLFPVVRRFPNARFGSRQCGLAATLPPDHNARVSRESAAKRGDVLRGRGEGKSYRKLNGRHEHRAVAEQKLGRPLLPGEIAHHADENKRNNDPQNIEVLPSQSEHCRLHGFGNKWRQK